LKAGSKILLDGQTLSGAVHEIEAGEYHFVVNHQEHICHE
jgi:hypothetical protein